MTVESRMHNAKALLDDALLNEIFDKLRADAIAAWLATPAVGGQEARDMCWTLVKAQERVKDALQSAVNDGLIAADRLTDNPSP